jgi:hypothetical protein
MSPELPVKHFFYQEFYYSRFLRTIKIQKERGFLLLNNLALRVPVLACKQELRGHGETPLGANLRS